MAKKHLKHRVTDTTDLLRRYRRTTKGDTIEGLDDVFVTYRMRRKIHTRLVDAPMKIVVMFAFFNAVGINALKYTYFYFFGKPEVFMTPYEFEQHQSTSKQLAEIYAELEKETGQMASDSDVQLKLLEQRLKRKQ